MYYLHAFNIFSIKSTVYTEICIGYTLDISERTGVFSSSIYILHKWAGIYSAGVFFSPGTSGLEYLHVSV